MIKANELRIGNMVYSKAIDGYFPISNLTSDYDPTCEPIPLTEEWLIKFGLKKSEENKDWYILIYMYEVFIDEDFDVVIDYWEEGRVIPIKEKLKHVHELQNLYFALTGEELTIKN